MSSAGRWYCTRPRSRRTCPRGCASRDGGTWPPRLALAPIGLLGIVPWHAARRETDGETRYACADAIFTTCASARQLPATASRRRLAPGAAPAVFVANPDGTLPGSALEADAICAALYRDTVYLGQSERTAAGGPGTPEEVLGYLLSALLVVPQFTLSTFGMIWLITALGWSAAAAGAVIAVSQFVGAFGRIFVGYLSDRVGSRMRVLRWVAVSGVAVMLALAAAGALHWAAASAIVLVIASTVSVVDNGLSFTSVAEAAGRAWSGRALGVQNTGQFIAASVVGPGLGALVAAVGLPVSFALVALTPLAAVPLVPSRDRHRA